MHWWSYNYVLEKKLKSRGFIGKTPEESRSTTQQPLNIYFLLIFLMHSLCIPYAFEKQ